MESTLKIFNNPFRPGAGHPPPYLAGRETEMEDFKKIISQDPILTNLIITGLRGVGKTVLMEALKPIAYANAWLWAGSDLSESASVSEETFSIRILTDLSGLLAPIYIKKTESMTAGYKSETKVSQEPLNYKALN